MRRWTAVVLAMTVSSAHADTTSDAAALDHLDRGIAAYRLGDYDTAHRELGLAQELAPEHPNPYRWLALTEIKQADCRDALVHIEAFLSRVPVGDPRVPEIIAARQQCLQEAQPAPVAAAQPAEEPAPITHRWWFWTAVGVVAVAAVGVTIAATRGSSESMLPPIHCSPSGCP